MGCAYAAKGSLQGIPSRSQHKLLCSLQAGPRAYDPWAAGRQHLLYWWQSLSSGAIDLVPFMSSKVSLIEKKNLKEN